MTAGLDELRSRAFDLWTQHADAELLQLRTELECDADMWTRVWAPACAIAAGRLGDGATAWALLDEAVAGGFSQPAVCEGELEEVFEADPRWPGLVARMRANVPPPAVELGSWPCPAPVYDLEMFRLAPDREERLRQRIPPPAATAWETAQQFLVWVSKAWRHDGIQHAGDDAHEILDRVEAGERFACVEYSTLLSQALNAVGIPARRLALRTANHHTGFGRGHVVSEAWIDELNRWVVLDGQNGAVWWDSADEPLGLVELLHRRVDELRRPRFVGLATEHSDTVAELWSRYFHTVTVEGLRAGEVIGTSWTPGVYSPVFQDRHWLGTDRLTTNLDALNQDLRGVHIGLAGTRDYPMLRLTSTHPYARELGLRTDGHTERVPTRPGMRDLPVADIPIPTGLGSHEAEIVVTTPYATLHSGSVSYLVRATET